VIGLTGESGARTWKTVTTQTMVSLGNYTRSEMSTFLKSAIRLYSDVGNLPRSVMRPGALLFKDQQVCQGPFPRRARYGLQWAFNDISGKYKRNMGFKPHYTQMRRSLQSLTLYMELASYIILKDPKTLLQ
jgi:hypothetical protein